MEEQWFRRYIRDNFIFYSERISYKDRDLRNEGIGKKIFSDVFQCGKDAKASPKSNEIIIAEVLEKFGIKVKVECKDFTGNPEAIGQYSFSEKDKTDGTYYTWYLKHTTKMTSKLDLAAKIIDSHLHNFDKKKLICQLELALFDKLEKGGLVQYIFNADTHSNTEEFKLDKSELFDRLYCLYVAKRKFPVSLDHVRQLQTLQVIEYLAYDKFFEENRKEKRRNWWKRFKGWLLSLYLAIFKRGQTSQNQAKYMTVARLERPDLKQIWEGLGLTLTDKCAIDEFVEIGPFVTKFYINTKEDLLSFFTAQPVIHPIFSRLTNYFAPFTQIRPSCMLDLKLVKQVLVGYEPGEVAHIENVLKGESKQRCFGDWIP
ncbi:MAG: hypothetical protein IPH04_18855 [Saprospirales bacterium]|nr:hypothetical protein [Saprospirales bacterium]